MVSKTVFIGALAASLALTACTPWGFAHDETLVGPYRLVAVDADEEMALCLSIPGGAGACVVDDLPGSTVYAAGFDDKYVVAARHPREFPGDSDRSVTEYYYIIRSADEENSLPKGAVKGPFDAEEYAAERKRLNLPDFSRVFEELR